MKIILKCIGLLVGVGVFICVYQIIIPVPIAQIPEDTSEYTAEELEEMRMRLEQQTTSIEQTSKPPPVATAKIPNKVVVKDISQKKPSLMFVVQDTEKSDYYETIIRNNLFQPLGWRPRTPPPQYQLIGTLVADNDKDTRAIILDRTSHVLHTVYVGYKMAGDMVVREIKDKRVILLDQDSKVTSLTMGRMLFIR